MGRHQALSLAKLGYAYEAMGDYGRAIASIQESLPIFRELQLAHYEQQALQTIEAANGSNGIGVADVSPLAMSLSWRCLIAPRLDHARS